MSKTFSTMKSEVLRNLQYKDDSSTPINTLKTDIGTWLNNRYRKVWTMRVWPEAMDEVDAILPANNNTLDLPSTLQTIVGIRNGTTVILPIDPSQINNISTALWTNTGDPLRFYQKGSEGIRLLGQYTTAQTISLFGKKAFSELTSPGDTTCLQVDDILIAGATADGFKVARPIPDMSAYWENIYADLLRVKVNESEMQQSKEIAFKPWLPWSSEVRPAHTQLKNTTTSKVPI